MSRVDDLIAAGFVQVSRRYRLLARVPPGKTAIEALFEVDPAAARDIAAHAEERAGERYRRVHARENDRAELTDEEFREYLKKTGRAPVL